MSAPDKLTNSTSSYRLFSPRRVQALSLNTFRQLVRMKVFYFLLIFSVVIIASSFVVLRFSFEQELKILKDVSFGAMALFSSIFAIVGTALLIPKDVEDRTLYTILSKPVPRLEYLLGKLLGVLLLIAVSLVIMTVLFSAVLYFRQHLILEAKLAEWTSMGIPADQIEANRRDILRQGLTGNVYFGVVAIFLKASVAAALALAISTIANSTLFTIIVSLVIYFIGHVQAIAREYWFHAADLPVSAEYVISGVVAIGFPDFRIFNIVDGIVSGELVPPGTMLRLCGLALFYVAIYNLVAYLIFARKEL